MNAIEDNQFVDGFRNIVKKITKPQAILCISAHWYTQGTKVTAMEMPRTIHDFGGFPKALYDVQYPAKGSIELAKEVQRLLTNTDVVLDMSWGLDHGVWSVLKHLYPNADVPVVQLSIDYTKTPESHFELAKQLMPLRNKEILIIGSGNIIHNLSLVDYNKLNTDNYGYDWAIEARETINQCLLQNNFESLIHYQNQSKALQLAIPTPEHFLPLIYFMALTNTAEKTEFFNDKLVAGSLSMTSLIAF